MAHLDVSGITYALPDGRPLLDEVSFGVGDGARVALVGPNGTGKTTLVRLITGDLDMQDGAITRQGAIAHMSQLVGRTGGEATVRDLLLGVAPERIRQASEALDAAELAVMEVDDEPAQMAYAQALSDWGDAGGYEFETTVWDAVCTDALGLPFERARWRDASTLSGGEQKRLVLEAMLAGPADILVLDEPDNFLDVPAKIWLEERLRASSKSVLLVSHDRELLSATTTAVVTLEPGAAGAVAWTHPASFATWHDAREARNADLAEQLKRWEEERLKLKRLVQMYKQKAAYNSDMSSRYSAAVTRLERFEKAGPPEKVSIEQDVRMRLVGGRTAKRAIVAEGLTLLDPGDATGGRRLMDPFDAEIWFGERVAVLGSNGSGKSHLLRLLAGGGTTPEKEHLPVGDTVVPSVPHTGVARLGSRVRPGWFAQTHEQPALHGRTLVEILHRGDEHRVGRPRDLAARALDRYGLARSAEQTFDSLSGGQQARFQILLLELSGATLLLLDEPTDNLDLHSAEALQEALAAFEGTVVAVTHDRWFARSFDRFLVLGSDGTVRETSEPVWDEARVARQR
ncbi:ABC-F family ATP-binding cassette domain-containing protein [Georgenia sp. Z1344]|uniref:ABC-F family ATP-binding cassette domain-containing protein n=1 Tax=Georgenia sp. Z1344 TaxID=3416706 RepID=UPI003CF8E651